MGVNSPHLLPKLVKQLAELGENIKLARLRRKLSLEQVCERANMGRNTLISIEKGSPSVAIGFYMQALFVFGLDKDVAMIAKDDELGRKLQDAGLVVKNRAPKRNKQ